MLIAWYKLPRNHKTQRSHRNTVLWLRWKNLQTHGYGGRNSGAKRCQRGAVVKEAAPVFGGGGGGRPNFAQGGGTKCDKLHDAVKTAEEKLKNQLKR